MLGRFLQRSYSEECCKFLWDVFSVKIIILPQTLPDVQESVPECVSSPPLPADHVLNSGAVLFPGSYSSTLLCLLDNVFYVQQWLILQTVSYTAFSGTHGRDWENLIKTHLSKSSSQHFRVTALK